jgi:hypothetical protein
MNIIFLVGVDLTTKSLIFFENILLQSVPQVPHHKNLTLPSRHSGIPDLSLIVICLQHYLCLQLNRCIWLLN